MEEKIYSRDNEVRVPYVCVINKVLISERNNEKSWKWRMKIPQNI